MIVKSNRLGFIVWIVLSVHIWGPINRCTADLIIDVQDLLLPSGSLGYIDVLIRSNGTDELHWDLSG